MSGSKIILKNTFILYGKMFLTVGISLYTTRVVLSALGDIDFGIYSLIAGVIAMLSFLNVAMSTSTQRYLSFYQGYNNLNIQKEIFENSLFLHILLGVFIFILVEVVGLFLFDGVLNIPENRKDASYVVYHLMSLTIFFSILSVPFVASINAHENMYWIAIVGILDVILKLIVALILLYASINIDYLIFYASSMAFIGFVVLLLYAIFCLDKYQECSLNIFGKVQKKTLLNLSSFATWNLFGSLCALGRSQGLAVILNFFLGATINTAYGIANQVSGQMNFFSATLLRAMNPQIMKAEGSKDREKMLDLSMKACKYGYCLLAIIAIPSIVEMSSILNFWLKSVPEYAIIFCKLLLISIIINQLTIGVQSAIQATGKIKMYQMIVGSVILINLPIAFILLELGFPAYSVLISYIFVEIIAASFRLIILHKITSFPLKDYFNKVLLKILGATLASVIVCVTITYIFDFPLRFLLTIVLSALAFIIMILLAGLDQSEKKHVNHKIKNIIYPRI